MYLIHLKQRAIQMTFMGDLPSPSLMTEQTEIKSLWSKKQQYKTQTSIKKTTAKFYIKICTNKCLTYMYVHPVPHHTTSIITYVIIKKALQIHVFVVITIQCMQQQKLKLIICHSKTQDVRKNFKKSK